jgi:hypothetical protein
MNCGVENLPRLAVEASIYFARVARLYHSFRRVDASAKTTAKGFVEEARKFLEQVLEL